MPGQTFCRWLFIMITDTSCLHDTTRRSLITHYYGLLPLGVRSFLPTPPYFTGYSDHTLYDWDQYFEGILLCNLGWPTEYLKNGVRIFLNRQEEDGFVARAFNVGYPGSVHIKHRTMIKPFLGQILLLCHHQSGQSGWLLEEGLWEKLLRYVDCWRSRFRDSDSGLSFWFDAGQTGMDNHYDRAGDFGGDTGFCAGCDLNSYLVRELKALAVLADILGQHDDARSLRAESEALANAMQEYLWNDEESMYYDWHVGEKRHIAIKAVSAFAPLWAEVPSESQANRLVQSHLLNEEEFWRPWPIPALAATEPGYVEGFLPDERTTCCSWRGNTWIPTNYITFQGLRRYGMTEVAQLLADKTYQLFKRSTFSEYYTAESGVGCGKRPFWGWSTLAVYMHVELELGLDPTALLEENPACTRMHALRQEGAL